MRRVAAAVVCLMATCVAPSARAEDSPAAEARDAFVRDQRGLMTVLGAFSLGSIASGTTMIAASRDPLVRAAGVQNVAWGAIDGTIALVAVVKTNASSHLDASEQHWIDARATSQRIFAINAGLDVLYVVAGALLVSLGKTDTVRGSGGGILAQGGFLLAFDSAGVWTMAPRAR